MNYIEYYFDIFLLTLWILILLAIFSFVKTIDEKKFSNDFLSIDYLIMKRDLRFFLFIVIHYFEKNVDYKALFQKCYIKIIKIN